MLELPIHHFEGRDGARLAYREIGDGRPLVLIHGYISTASVNWIRPGSAEALAVRGYRVVMPDLRGHGDSDTSHDQASYPPDVLVDDGFALIDHLGLSDYDLGGYSLGARTVVRMLVRGATPRRVIVAGMGLDSICSTGPGGERFRHILTNLGTFERGSGEWMAEAFLKTNRADPVALLHVLDTWVDTPQDALARIETPTLVVIGADDDDHASAEKLAATLPHALFVVVPGNHMSAVTKPDLAAAIGAFLDDAVVP